LNGQLERCITEAIKLHVLGHEFGAVVMNGIGRFLGPQDPLMQRSGWEQLRSMPTRATPVSHAASE